MNLRVRCIVAGTRTFDDYRLLSSNLIDIFRSKSLEPWNVEIVSGGAEGADELGEQFANILMEHGQDIKLKVIKADWDRRGRSAGYIRNKEMALYAKSNPDGLCICFWDGISDGTRNMIKTAEEEGLEVHVINY